MSYGDDRSFLEGKLVVVTQSSKSGSPFDGSCGPENEGLSLLFGFQYCKGFIGNTCIYNQILLIVLGEMLPRAGTYKLRGMEII